MTRKQMGIILTLMALIVCVGVLSMKLNENGLLDQQVGLESVLEKNDDSTKETLWISTKNIHAKDKPAQLCAHLPPPPPHSQQHFQVTS